MNPDPNISYLSCPQLEPADCGGDAPAGQELRQGAGGRGEDDARAARHQERGQAGPQAAPGGEGGRADDQQRGAAARGDAGHDRVQVTQQ